METKITQTFKKYFSLPDHMPDELITEIKKSGETLILYGLSSLGRRDRIEEWVASPKNTFGSLIKSFE